ncbi:MAG: 5-methyltetrahydropteroyltriglutamate--homocysteine methyltransferase [Alphaproteobacteria bacterium]|nr:5-methyltetrahydropteroyltriglutamate--homocysteine methyltransferase [Alphaproteobacteria bacterium]
MTIQTTCIGAYPKPDYVPIIDWFGQTGGLAGAGGEVTRQVSKVLGTNSDASEQLFVRATGRAIMDQVDAGINVPTDGEQRRENYIHYHCRHLKGFDFENLTATTLRDGAYTTDLPTISGPVSPDGSHFLDHDFTVASQFTQQPVKITVPGPLTIMDTTANRYYDDEKQFAFDLAEALNFEILALARAGCRNIQIDEPVFARNISRALDFGIECLERCFHGLPAEVARIMHMCCGYPQKLDDRHYKKADQSAYSDLATAIDVSCVDQVSIEDAHRHNDLALLEKFERTTVIFGAVAIADSQVEPVEQIVARLRQALCHIDRDRLMAAPDCGLAMLGRDLAMQKLKNLCAAAKLV